MMLWDMAVWFPGESLWRQLAEVSGVAKGEEC